MSTTGQSSAPADAASDVAAACSGADFVVLRAHADGDAVAAAGLLARALDARGLPYQASVTSFGLADPEPGDDATVVTLGGPAPADGVAVDPAGSVAAVAAEAVRGLDREPAAGLALAGVVASGADPARTTPELLGAAEASGIVGTVPGVAVPTADLVDGLAHTTLVHARFSGDPEAARDAIAGAGVDPDARDWLGEDGNDGDTADRAGEATGRTVASLVALATAGDAGAAHRAGETVGRALRPLAWRDGPLATVAGAADVLDAAARESPGVALALAGGHDVAESALEAWRDRSRRAHEAVRTATTSAYDDLFVARLETAPTATVARLLRDYRTDAPVAVVATEGRASVASVADQPIADAAREAAAAVEGRVAARQTAATVTYDGDAMDFVSAFREAR